MCDADDYCQHRCAKGRETIGDALSAAGENLAPTGRLQDFHRDALLSDEPVWGNMRTADYSR